MVCVHLPQGIGPLPREEEGLRQPLKSARFYTFNLRYDGGDPATHQSRSLRTTKANHSHTHNSACTPLLSSRKQISRLCLQGEINMYRERQACPFHFWFNTRASSCNLGHPMIFHYPVSTPVCRLDGRCTPSYVSFHQKNGPKSQSNISQKTSHC